jgi:hypothetical protein
MAVAAGLVNRSAFSISVGLTPWMQVSQARPDLVGRQTIFCSVDFHLLYVIDTIFPFILMPSLQTNDSFSPLQFSTGRRIWLPMFVVRDIASRTAS